MKLTILGTGRGAWAIGELFTPPDLVECVGSRDPSVNHAGLGSWPLDTVEHAASSSSELLLFAVPDDVIQPLYERLQDVIPTPVFPFHLSGSLPSGIFHRHRGFSLHPLRALPAPGTPGALAGSRFVWEGNAQTASRARRIVAMADGTFTAIDSSLKPLYHAAAVVGANYVALIAEEARVLMDAAGVTAAREAVGGLAMSAIANWVERPDSAFTGPIVRGDFGTIAGHLAALEGHPRIAEMYRELGLRLIDVLEKEGPVPRLQEIRKILAGGDGTPR